MGVKSVASSDFEKALKTGRPGNVAKLFPNSRALIVSGRFIDRAMLAKGKAIAIAANGRSYFVSVPTRRSSSKSPDRKGVRKPIAP
jgi:hypothetical protein